jgi:hypothetical protein
MTLGGLPGLQFHHFGLVVAEPDEAFCYLEALGYEAGNVVFDPLQRVNLAMRHHPSMPDVEVIWPGNEPSPIDTLLKGGRIMIYHICYACSDPAATLAALDAAGCLIMEVSPAKPAVLFGGLAVSFHQVSGFGLIELLHTGSPGQI